MPSRSKFRHQDISLPGAGTKVRTVHAGKHELRIAFPKGARKKGSGKLVSILHPEGEKNPDCGGALTLAEIQALEIPLAALPQFSRRFEGALDTDGQNPSGWKEKWDDLRDRIAKAVAPQKKSNGKRRSIYEVKNPTGEKIRITTLGRDDEWMASAYPIEKGKPLAGRWELTRFGKSEREAYDAVVAELQRGKRNYTEEVHTSDGKTVFVDVLGSNDKWWAEGYPVISGKIRRVGKPKIAHGRTEAEAYDNLIDKLERNPFRRRNIKARRNLDEIQEAAKLAERFQGSPAEQVTESAEPHKMRDDFAHLGWEDQMVFVPSTFRGELDCKGISNFYHKMYTEHENTERAWKEVQKEFAIPLLVYDVSDAKIELVASADGKQLYLIGGKQQEFASFLPDFRTNLKRDRVDLGDMLSTTYTAQKAQAGDDEPRPYYHVFGEEGGYPPGAIYDTLNKRILLFGGSYHLDEAERGIIN